jgi:hypothetical protein
MAVTGLNAGTHNLVFDYSGDGNFAPSTRTLAQIVTQATTTTTLAALPTVFYGEAVSLQATITATTAPNPTAGVVTFFDTLGTTTTTLGSVTLSGTNVAVLPTGATQLAAGTHSIKAVYTNTGVPDYASSPTTPAAAQIKSQIVTKATTSATVTTLTPTAPFGNQVTFTATITATSPGTPGNPTTGTVNFYNIFTPPGGTTTTTLLNSTPVSLSGSNSVTFTTSFTQLVVGTHTIKAVYAGNANFAASTTFANQTEVITKADANVAISTSAASGTLTYGKSVTITAIVSVGSGSPGTPTGTVSFFNGATLLKGSVTLVKINATSAKAVFTTTATQLSAGTHNIIANYNATGNFASTSDSIIYDVQQAQTITKLTWTPTYWALNQPVTFVATVTNTSGGTPGLPTGSVTFDVDGTPVTVNMVSGKATLALTATSLPNQFFTTPGNHTVTATYNPTANFLAGPPATQTQDVEKASSVSMTSSSTVTGVNITATVTGAGGTPTGTVNFYENGKLLNATPVPLVNGVAKISLPLSSGTHYITVVYSGDFDFNPATRTQAIAGKILGRLV